MCYHVKRKDKQLRRTAKEVIATAQPSNEVKARWKERTYKQYNVCLRYDTDQKLIDWIAEQHKPPTEIFREVLNKHLKTEG